MTTTMTKPATPRTGVELYDWAKGRLDADPDILRRLRQWGRDNGHRDILSVWSPGAVAAALRWLGESPEK